MHGCSHATLARVAPTGHVDYSGTPLWRKLGISEGARAHLTGTPADLDLEAIAPLPDGVTFLRRLGRDLDVVVCFVTREAELARRLPALAGAIGPAGGVWIAWPKKAAQTDSDLTFEIVQAAGLAAGLVDNKSAAITDVFQGLQFVVRVRDRASRGTGRPR
jgi:hypothetical protein